MMHVMMIMSVITACGFFLLRFFGSFRLGLEGRKTGGLRLLFWQFDKRDDGGFRGDREVSGTF